MSGDDDLSTVFLSAGPAASSAPLPGVRPLSPSVPLSLPGLPAPSAGGGPSAGLSSLLTGSSAEAELVKGVLAHQLVLNQRSMRAAVFLYSCGLSDLMWTALELKKFHARPGNLIKALDAVSLKDYMAELRVSVGNK